MTEEDELDTEEISLVEIFCADGSVAEDDGLVWKEILREGQWAYRPGVSGKPTPVPLKVIAGKTKEKNQISMQDLIDSFNEAPIDHVTVPTTHDDKPEQNTGYVRKLKKVTSKGKARLLAGIEFTEPDIKEKAERGSIANTSAGILFDYIKKETGKVFAQVLGHVALTNKPWINGMKPFGVAASENFEDEQIMGIVLTDVVWNQDKSFTGIRKSIQTQLGGEFFVVDLAKDKALVASQNSTNNETFVVPFENKKNTVTVSTHENWIPASKEWVQASLENSEARKKTLSDDDNGKASNKGASDPEEGGSLNMGSIKDKTKTDSDATSGDPAPDQKDNKGTNGNGEVVLTEEKLDELRSEFTEQKTELSSENEDLRKKIHAMEVKERINDLQKIGFSDFPGLLREIEVLLSADNGKPALVLSEKVGDTEETKEVSLTATEVVERIINKLPKTEEGKLKMSEQSFMTEDHSAPPTTVDNSDERPVSERAAAMASATGFDYKSKKDGEQ